jgi:hypothetical protein
MSTRQCIRRTVVVCALVGAALVASTTEAEATHFRYGTITWQIANPATPNIVTLRFDSAWRRSFGWIPANPSVGQTISGQLVTIEIRNSLGEVIAVLAPTATVTAVNATEDWFAATYTTRLTLPEGVYTARFTACCRLTTLKGGNADRDFLVTAGITVRVPPDAVNQPPTASTLPIIKLARNQPAIFPVPAADPDGDVIAYRLATSEESMLAQPAPPGLTLSSTGVVRWTPTINGLYAIQVRVTDPVGAHTVVDLILEVIDAVGEPPSVLINDTAGPKTFTTVHGSPFTFTVAGADPENRPVMLTSSSLPIGAKMTPSLPTTAINATTTFTWTPAAAQVGTYVMNFAALDGDGRQSRQSVTLTVTNNLPVISCIASDGHIEAVGPAGGPFGVTADVHDGDKDRLTVSVSIDGVIKQTSALLTPPTSVSFFATQPLGTHTYEVRVSDGLGAATCDGSFTVADTRAPTIVTPDNLTVTAESAAGATVAYRVQAEDIVDPTPALRCAPPSGSVFPIGTTTVACTAVDAAGNENAATFVVSVTDPSGPVVTPVATGSLGRDNWYVGEVTVAWTTADPESGISSRTGCDTTVVTTDTTGSSFTCTATNGSGLSTTASVTIARDATAPAVVWAIPSIVAEATSAAGAAVRFDPPTVTDNGSGVAGVTACTHASESTFPIGVTTVTCTATDAAGNSGSSGLAITVADRTPPVVGEFADVIAEAANAAGAAVTYAMPGVSDSVDATVDGVCTPVSGTVFALGDTVVSCTATDDSGNTAATTMTVTVRDTTPPSIAPFADISLVGLAPSGARATWSETATDTVDGLVAVTCTPASGSTFAYGATSVTCQATDAAQNSSVASFTVTVIDATPPVVTPVVDGTMGENGWYISDIAVSWNVADDESTVASRDGCGAASVSSDGAAFVFMCTATSAGGLTSRSLTVRRDASRPALDLPAAVTAEAATPAGALVSYAATAIDPLSGVAAVSCLPVSGALFPLGTTIVSCMARDHAGLESRGAFTVTVQDTIAPVITRVTPSAAALWPANHAMHDIMLDVAASDNLGPAPACTVTGVSSNEPENGLGDGDTPNDWVITGELSVQLRAERAAGGAGRTYTVALRCSDASGNAATSSATVTVPKSPPNN